MAAAKDLFDGVPSVEDIRFALRVWHKPARLTQTRLANSRLVLSKLRGSNDSSEGTFANVSASRQLLLDAIGQLNATQPSSQRRDLQNSLAYCKYVLLQSAHVICHDKGFATATLDRHLARELAELCAILANIALALPANGMANATQPATFASEIPHTSFFVGREQPLKQARGVLLAAHTSAVQNGLVAITGYPGSGKTSLAAIIARDPNIAKRYRDGVLWASVGHSNGVRDVLARWVAEIGLDDHGVGKLPLAQQRGAIRTALAGKRLLIILDDVWHVEDAHALTLGGPGTAYVLTTRQPVVAHDLADTVITLEDFDHAETLALLHMHLSDDLLHQQKLNVNLGELAATLRGLPLSVSVAARHLSRLAKTGQHRRFNAYVASAFQQERVQVLADRMGDAIHALDGLAQSALATLAQLPPKPNTFSEGFALRVCQCETFTLDVLVDAGLLDSQHGRYTLHPAIAECVNGLLNAATVRQAIVEQTTNLLEDSTQTALTSRDVLTICAVLSIADTTESNEGYIAIATNAAQLIEDSGDLSVLLQVLERADHMAADVDAATTWRSRINIQLAHAHWLSAPSDQTFAELVCVTHHAENSGDPDLVAIASRTMADIAFERDDFTSAIDFVNSAAAAWQTYQAKHKERVEAAALRRYMLRSPFEKLREMLVRVIPASIAKAVPAPQVQVAVTAKGWLDVLHGDVATGMAQLNECFERSVRNGYHLPDIFASGALAWAHYHLGDYGKARLMGYHVIHAPYRDVYSDFVGQAYHALAASALAQGDYAGAWSFLIEGLNYCDDHSADVLASALHATMANWHLQQGHPQEAWPCAELALRIACQMHFEPMIPAALAMLGTVECKLSQGDAARGRFDEMAARIGKLKASPWTEAYCRLHLGEFLLAVEAFEDAERQLLRTVDLGRSLSAPEFVGLGCFALAKIQRGLNEFDQSSTIAAESITVLRHIGHRTADEAYAWSQHTM